MKLTSNLYIMCSFLALLSLFNSVNADKRQASVNTISKITNKDSILQNKLINSKHPPSHINIDNIDIETASTVEETSNLTFPLILRAIYLFTIFMPILLTSGFAYISSIFRKYVWFSMISWAISWSGAAFIKWGQWSSTRSDMFPEEFCNLLSELQSNAPRHSYAYTAELIQQELGLPIDMVFDVFAKEPVASGSIAQVYKAKLKGRDVAVKVRHPNVELQIKLDFIIMKSFAKFLENYFGMAWLNLSESLIQFSHTIAAQTRLDIEGQHLFQLNKNFQHWKEVSFPESLILTKGVLVESWEWGQIVSKFIKTYTVFNGDSNSNGSGKSSGSSKVNTKGDNIKSSRSHTPPSEVITPTSDTTASDNNQFNPLSNTLSTGSINGNINHELLHQERDLKAAFMLITRGEDLYLKMLFQDNLMHADLHPGNMILQQRHTYYEHNHLPLFDEYIKPMLLLIQDDVKHLLHHKQQAINQNTVESGTNTASGKSNSNNSVSSGSNTESSKGISDSILKNDINNSYKLIADTHQYNQAVQSLSWPTMDRFVLVDAGMVAELSDKEQINFIGLLESIGEGGDNGSYDAANHLLEFHSASSTSFSATSATSSTTKRGSTNASNRKNDRKNSSKTDGENLYSPEQIQAFQYEMKLLFRQVCKGYYTGTDIGEVLRGVLSLIRKHRILIETNYATLVMNILCLDGIAKTLLPTYNVLDAAQPLLQFHRKFRFMPFQGVTHVVLKKVLSLMLWRKKQKDNKILKKLLKDLHQRYSNKK